MPDASAPPRAPYRPSLMTALVLALLLTSIVQAWQIVDPPPGATPVYVAATEEPDNGPALPASPEPAQNATEAAAAAEASPVFEAVTSVEAPKYRINVDFTWEFHVSGSPLVVTPWTGDGAPFLLAYYQGLTDLQIRHHGSLSQLSYTGFDVCESRILRFWNWTAVVANPPVDDLVYQSNPVPENPYNLLGAGENCYARAVAASLWKASLCMEGDGVIAKPWDETDAEGRLVHHVDTMDHCLFADVGAPA